MNLPLPNVSDILPRPTPQEHSERPGRVRAITGVIFQNDGQSTIGRLFIRPFAALDRWIAGVLPSREQPPLAMHAALHVVMDDGREVVAEQLVGSLYFDAVSGLNWTPLADFRRRDRGGWDTTAPLTAFRGVDEDVVAETVVNLNRIDGHPFVGEDCTAFIERACGGRRLFADSPLLRTLGIGARVGDPALPLLKPGPEGQLDARSERLLHAEALRRLPSALADPLSPNARTLVPRLLLVAGAGALLGHQAARRRGR